MAKSSYSRDHTGNAAGKNGTSDLWNATGDQHDGSHYQTNIVKDQEHVERFLVLQFVLLCVEGHNPEDDHS